MRVIRADRKKGIGQKQLYESPPCTWTGTERTGARMPNPQAKKSPSGDSTAGSSAPSQYIRRTISSGDAEPPLEIQLAADSGKVNQRCRITPGPSISASV